MPFRFIVTYKTEKKTAEDVKKKWEEAGKNKKSKQTVVERMEAKIKSLEGELLSSVEKIRDCIIQLDSIALKTAATSSVAYLQQMIETERMNQNLGYLDRIKELEIQKKNAEALEKIAHGGNIGGLQLEGAIRRTEACKAKQAIPSNNYEGYDKHESEIKYKYDKPQTKHLQTPEEWEKKASHNILEIIDAKIEETKVKESMHTNIVEDVDRMINGRAVAKLSKKTENNLSATLRENQKKLEPRREEDVLVTKNITTKRAVKSLVSDPEALDSFHQNHLSKMFDNNTSETLEEEDIFEDAVEDLGFQTELDNHAKETEARNSGFQKAKGQVSQSSQLGSPLRLEGPSTQIKKAMKCITDQISPTLSRQPGANVDEETKFLGENIEVDADMDIGEESDEDIDSLEVRIRELQSEGGNVAVAYAGCLEVLKAELPASKDEESDFGEEITMPNRLEKLFPFDSLSLAEKEMLTVGIARLADGQVNFICDTTLIQALVDKLSSVELKEKVLKHFIEEALPEDQGSELCLLFDGTNSGVNAVLKIILMAN